MTGKPSSDPNDWTSLWANAQQQYWQSWFDLAQKANPALSVKPPEPPPNPWSQSFDFWGKLMSGAAPTESRDWVEKMFDVNKGYLHMGEMLWKTLSAMQHPPQTAEAWTEAVQRGIRQMQESFGAGFGGAGGAGKDPWAAFATFWGLPMDHWKRVTSACSLMPGDMEKVLRGLGAVHEGPESLLSRMLSMPTLGYTREWQEEVQRWGQLWLEYGTATRDYANNVLAKITARAGELLGSRLADLNREGNTPATLKAFYDLWVDCGELAYAEMATTPEFTSAQARLLNTLMAVKRQEQKMVDETLSALNMPTRRELDTSHQRLHQLRRQVWRLQDTVDESGIRELREEVAALRREVEALRAEKDAPKSARQAASREPKANV